MGSNREYRDGETIYVDGVDADKMALTEIHSWAYDLGYSVGPIAFWYKILGSDLGTDYISIYKDSQVVDMVKLAPRYTEGSLDVYIVSLGARKSLEELEAEEQPVVVNHLSYFGHIIIDLPLIVSGEVNVEQVEAELMEEEEVRRDDVMQEEDGQHNTYIPDDEELMEQTFGRSDGGKEQAENVVEEAGANIRKKKKKCVEEDDGDEDHETDSEDENDALVDSDYDVNDSNEDGDLDDEMETARADEFGDEGNMSGDDFQDGDSDFLESGEESDEEETSQTKKKKKKFKWPQFRVKTDMNNPEFVLGMLFENADAFKKAVKKHAVLTKKELRFSRNTKCLVSVKCKTSSRCPWYIYASSIDQDNSTLQVKVYKAEHTCCSVGKKVFYCGATFLAEEYHSQFIADEK